MDDPLSAGKEVSHSRIRCLVIKRPHHTVDAHVGKSLFHGAIAGLAKSGKTVVFVTHALHFLSFCDYIYTLNAGRISEHGTYRELIEAQGEFARLDEEFGGQEAAASTSKGSQSAVLEEVQNKTTELRKRHPGKGTLEGKLIVKETRNTGTIGSNGRYHSGYVFFVIYLTSKNSVAGLPFCWEGIYHNSLTASGGCSNAGKPDH